MKPPFFDDDTTPAGGGEGSGGTQTMERPGGGGDYDDLMIPGLTVAPSASQGDRKPMSPEEAVAAVEAGDYEGAGEGGGHRGGSRGGSAAGGAPGHEQNVAAAQALFGWTREQAAAMPPQMLAMQIQQMRSMASGMPGMMPGGMPPGGMPGMMPGGMPGMMPGGMPGMMPGGMPNSYSPPAGGYPNQPHAAGPAAGQPHPGNGNGQGQGGADLSRLRYQFKHIKPDGESGVGQEFIDEFNAMQDHLIGLISQVDRSVGTISSSLLDRDVDSAFRALKDPDIFGKGRTHRLQPGSPQRTARDQLVRTVNQWVGQWPHMLEMHGVEGLIDMAYQQMFADRIKEKKNKQLHETTSRRAGQTIARPTQRKAAGAGTTGMSPEDKELAEKRAYWRMRGFDQ